MIRKNNPDSEIVWAYGMLGYGKDGRIENALKDMIENYCEKTGDKKVHFLHLPNTTDKTVGAREHPGDKNHRESSKVLCDYLSRLLKMK